MLRSMLQQLDGQLGARETFHQDQQSKLSEKEKIISSQKSEIERLEKKSKTLEYKVLPLLSPEVLRTYGVANGTNIVFVCPPAQVDILQKTTEMYEQDKRSLQHELESREQRLLKELMDKRRVEHRMQGAVSDANAKWEKECVSKTLRLGQLDYEGIRTDF